MILFGITIIEIILLIVSPIILLLILAREKFAWAVTFTLLAIGLGVWLNWDEVKAIFGGPDVFAHIAAVTGAYVLAGLIFSLVKWFFHVRKHTKYFSAWLDSKLITGGTLEQRAVRAFTKGSDYTHQSTWSSGSLRFSVDDSMGRLLWEHDKVELTEYVAAWTTWWPFFLVLLVLEDFLVKFFDLVVDLFGNAYKNITNFAVKSVK